MRKIQQRLLDFIYPAMCQICERPLTHGINLCSPCIQTMPPIKPPYCQTCGEAYDGAITKSFTCPNCHKRKLSFDFARAGYRGTKSTLELVHNFKYKRQIHLSKDIAELTLTGLDDTRFHPYIHDGILIPVPLHWRRYNWRRFNQSQEIAYQISKLKPELHVLNALKRTKYTQTQTSYTRAMRLTNLKDTFRVRQRLKKNIQNKHIILIDDVFTTGSTANECSKTLLDAGAHKVAVLTFLRG